MNLTKSEKMYLAQLCYNDAIAWTETIEAEQSKKYPNIKYLGELATAHDHAIMLYNLLKEEQK